MSRSGSNAVQDQATSESKTNFDNSQNSYVQTQNDVGNYQDQLAKYSAADPFNAGGEFQTAENKVLSAAAGGVADSARTELQSGSARRGDNPALANAQAASIADSSQRTLAGEEGAAEATRIGKEADYGKSVLDATKFPVEAESDLYKGASGASNQELSVAQDAAAHSPSFGDVFGESFAENLGKTLGGGNQKGKG